MADVTGSTYVPEWATGPCTCRHAEASLGRLHGVSMGRGVVRIGTTPNCPVHDACRHFTKAYRAAITESWRKNPFCPKHPKKPCPDPADQPTEVAGDE